MGRTARDVIEGRERWGVECSDALAWLRSLPDDSVDLLFTSPPYLTARTYSRTDVARSLHEWIEWMMTVVRTAAPKVKGLIAINCEGQTRDYRYYPAPSLLEADLHRAGFNLRRRGIYHRVGIPGSGGPDWLRADTEAVVCISRPGKLPWSDNTAMGHPPKWAPGGEMANRLSNGTRVNQLGKTVGNGQPTAKARTSNGTRDVRKRPSHKMHTKRDANGTMREQGYNVPTLANPGNLVQRTYTADEVAALLAEASEVAHCNVGGGQMGHTLSHENEAPFPVELPAFFIKSFAPPGGIVADCFMGSGTTIDAAVQHGRRGIGCDVRQSQCDLTERRMSTVTPALEGFA